MNEVHLRKGNYTTKLHFSVIRLYSGKWDLVIIDYILHLHVLIVEIHHEYRYLELIPQN